MKPVNCLRLLLLTIGIVLSCLTVAPARAADARINDFRIEKQFDHIPSWVGNKIIYDFSTEWSSQGSEGRVAIYEFVDGTPDWWGDTIFSDSSSVSPFADASHKMDNVCLGYKIIAWIVDVNESVVDQDEQNGVPRTP
jgi:hypothetical protein